MGHKWNLKTRECTWISLFSEIIKYICDRSFQTKVSIDWKTCFLLNFLRDSSQIMDINAARLVVIKQPEHFCYILTQFLLSVPWKHTEPLISIQQSFNYAHALRHVLHCLLRTADDDGQLFHSGREVIDLVLDLLRLCRAFLLFRVVALIAVVKKC